MRRRIAALAAVLAALALAGVACSRHVVVDRDAAIRGLGDPDWTVSSEPKSAPDDDSSDARSSASP